MNPAVLKRLIRDQRDEERPIHYVDRTAQSKLDVFSKNKEIIVVTGVRRCGKSVLVQHARNQNAEKDYYFNFEDERLVTFTVDDFQLLQETFVELFGIQKTYYFDEIQNIEGWELFIRRLYNNGNKVYITGSNATLFSDELGTRLTGRYISLTMYPFSFYEYAKSEQSNLIDQEILSTTQIGLVKKLFNEYCELGGFPEYINNQQIDYLHSLYEGIIYRDIVARYKITNVKSIKELVYYLATNCSKEITYTSLKNLLGLGSATTVSDYCSYLENSYLCFFVNRYNESVKTQMRSPKKVYFIDHALAKTVGFHFSEDSGRMLENIVFIELKRRGYDVYYHKEDKECDFVVRQNGKIVNAIQVCQSLDSDKTRQREIDGLLEAQKRFSLKKGYILTDREDEITTIKQNDIDYTIIILPLWKWLVV